MRFIKYLNLLLIIGVVILFSLSLSGCATDKPVPEPEDTLSQEELKRIDLYANVMRAAFNEENGGNKFIAVKLDTLEGLSMEGKARLMKELKDLSPQVCDFEAVKLDPEKFKMDEDNRHQYSIDGTVLWIKLNSYSGNQASIEATSWFGNLGAVFPDYEATYRDGVWHLKLISMAVS